MIPLIDKIHKFCPKIGLAKHILQRLLVDKQKHNFIVEKDQTPELTPELNPEFIKKYVAENVIVNENTGFLHNCGQLNIHELQSKVMEMLKEDVEFDKILAKINFITEGHSKTIPWRWEKDLHDWFQRNRPDSNDSEIVDWEANLRGLQLIVKAKDEDNWELTEHYCTLISNSLGSGKVINTPSLRNSNGRASETGNICFMHPSYIYVFIIFSSKKDKE